MAVHATKEGEECAIKMEDGALSLLWFALVMVIFLPCNCYLTITRINGHLKDVRGQENIEKICLSKF